MLVRVVKLSFKPEDIETFLANFETNKDKIRNFEGCEHLELWQDEYKSNQFFTYSHWVSEDALNNYRQSELFKNVWSKTKPLFNAKPEAWSVRQKAILD
ncbi:antibiotic biosynthesis monooxygenase family protein [Winogradskyella maritima]|uniref:Quinol monooxygenase n=1 Tax=Winogradskyella maritima TaxID=1517766 RepID=A0ABV8AJH3_9FLAO|nr:antibiotic biosynthesis monooxygenase family protein [Winogradskyella maritima]